MSVQITDLPFDVPLLPARWLRAGPLTCMYEHGNLRYIGLQGVEVLRMIYSAVRDKNWETAPYVIEDEVVVANETAFTITYTAAYELNQIRYKAFFTIEGNEDIIRFSMKGVALNSFQANRIGLCILHPINECAGRTVEIIQPGGSSYSATFPEQISPHQPFKQIQQMLWATAHGVQAQLIFEGDIFETEDQRNWTDASYKTYSRPLDLPYPYEVHEGDEIMQSVTLKVSGNTGAGAHELNVGAADEIKAPFPAIGYSRSKGHGHLSDHEIQLLRKVPFQHYRIELRMNEHDWINELSVAFSEAKQLNTSLELVVFFGNEIENDVGELLQKVQHEQKSIKSILVLHQEGIMPDLLFSKVYAALKRSLPEVKTGYGTDGFFAALNRQRPQMPDYDFVSFSINPQAHAVDTRTIIENLSGQVHTLNTAQTFAAGKAIHVSPVTFKRRSNNSKSIDERLHTSFGAWWTVQTIKNLSSAASITFYETLGPKGILTQSSISADTAPSTAHAAPSTADAAPTSADAAPSIGDAAPSTADAAPPTADSFSPVYNVLAAIHAFDPVFIIIQKENPDNLVIENHAGDRLVFSVKREA